MKTRTVLQSVTAGLLALSLLSVYPLYAQDKRSTSKPNPQQVPAQSGQDEATSQAEQKTTEKRKELIVEAAEALTATKNALAALDQDKPETALAALERATGKLTIVLAREPDLALAPVDVAVTTHDLYASLDAIKEARKTAEDHLEDGEIQKARPLLAALASEIVISVSNIPLTTYPEALKLAAAFIDEGKHEEAKTALQTARNTLVVTDHIISLPPVRAEQKLQEAETLAKSETRTDTDNEKLDALLKAAREQLKMAEALGYGKKEDYEKLYAQLDEIEAKTEGGQSGKGLFDKMKKSLVDFKESLFN